MENDNFSDTKLKEFDKTPPACKEVAKLLYAKYKGIFEFSEAFMANILHSYVEKTALRHIILLPHETICCGESIVIRNRPSFPIVYTSNGTFVAALFHGECRKSCSKKFSYSYWQSESQLYYYNPSGS